MELPPRARRILLNGLPIQIKNGTTSACAENTSPAFISMQPAGNYLRVRGEYQSTVLPHHRHWELPPRARRIHLASRCNRHFRGTTSACAENTKHFPLTLAHIMNYLRVRGEYRLVFRGCRDSRELPPRARRIRCGLHGFATRTGTTSACAENTHPANHRDSSRRNYLRVRGEYPTHATPRAPQSELPPRARRILSSSGIAARYIRNYLRVRGEYLYAVAVSWNFQELPPRARRIRTL